MSNKEAGLYYKAGFITGVELFRFYEDQNQRWPERILWI